jgi:hypothetical protein
VVGMNTPDRLWEVPRGSSTGEDKRNNGNGQRQLELPNVNCVGMNVNNCCHLWKNTLLAQRIPLVDIHGHELSCYPYAATMPLDPVMGRDRDGDYNYAYIDYFWEAADDHDDEKQDGISEENKARGGNRAEVTPDQESPVAAPPAGKCVARELTQDQVMEVEEQTRQALVEIVERIQDMQQLSTNNEETLLLEEEEEKKEQEKEETQKEEPDDRIRRMRRQLLPELPDLGLGLADLLKLNKDMAMITCSDLRMLQEDLRFHARNIIRVMNLLHELFHNHSDAADGDTMDMDAQPPLPLCHETRQDVIDTRQEFKKNGHVMDWTMIHGYKVLPDSMLTILDHLVRLLSSSLEEEDDNANANGSSIYIHNTIVIPTKLVAAAAETDGAPQRERVVAAIPRIGTQTRCP